MQPFRPLFRNPHFATIAGNFAPRRLDEVRFPTTGRCVQTEPDAQILVHSQRPEGTPKGEMVMVHGLEGSSNAGYMRSMAQLLLEHGYGTHRTNMRSCGGTESLAKTMYHAGMTSDMLALVRTLRAESDAPIFLTGFSLGGNVSLKLAGELGAEGPSLLAGVCAVSTPIDLAASVRKMSSRENRLYESRFLKRLKERIRKRAESMPGHYDLSALDSATSVYEFDDKVTAQHFGFGSADNYYATQSSINYLPRIQVPTLLVQAKDDPLIPFDIFDDVERNPNVRLIAAEYGGHLGFIADRAPRFWLDRVVLGWAEERIAQLSLSLK